MKRLFYFAFLLIFSLNAFCAENPDSVNQRLFLAGDRFLLEIQKYIETGDSENLIRAEEFFENEIIDYSKSDQFKNFSGKNRNYDILIDRLLTNARLLTDEDLTYEEKIKCSGQINQALLKISEYNSIFYNKSLNFRFILISCVFCLLVLSLILIFYLRRKNFRLKVEQQKNQEYMNLILEVLENEREKISNELHDTVAQEIQAIKIEAEKESQKDFRKISEISQNCVKEMREICYNLLPPDLKLNKIYVKVENLLEFLCEKFQRENPAIECNFRADENLPEIKNSDTMLNIFRIVQEALSNIKKHSKATFCSVVACREKNMIVIFITDNGTGIKKEILQKGRKFHFGLHSMKSRALAIGAEIQILSEIDDGTEIILKVKAK